MKRIRAVIFDLDGTLLDHIGAATQAPRRWLPELECFDDVDETLTAISELPVKTALLTNGTDEQRRAKLKAVGLEGRVGDVFTAESLGQPSLTSPPTAPSARPYTST